MELMYAMYVCVRLASLKKKNKATPISCDVWYFPLCQVHGLHGQNVRVQVGKEGALPDHNRQMVQAPSGTGK